MRIERKMNIRKGRKNHIKSHKTNKITENKVINLFMIRQTNATTTENEKKFCFFFSIFFLRQQAKEMVKHVHKNTSKTCEKLETFECRLIFISLCFTLLLLVLLLQKHERHATRKYVAIKTNNNNSENVIKPTWKTTFFAFIWRNGVRSNTIAIYWLWNVISPGLCSVCYNLIHKGLKL